VNDNCLLPAYNIESGRSTTSAMICLLNEDTGNKAASVLTIRSISEANESWNNLNKKNLKKENPVRLFLQQTLQNTMFFVFVDIGSTVTRVPLLHHGGLSTDWNTNIE
jgi:hypothetical protein